MSNFGDVLKEYREVGDLQSNLTLYMAVEKLSKVLKEERCFYIDVEDEQWPDLIIFEKWLSRMAFVLEAFSAFTGEQKRITNREKRLTDYNDF